MIKMSSTVTATLESPGRAIQIAAARLLGVVLIFVGLFLGATAASAGAGDYTLGEGDKIRVTILGAPDWSGEFSVRDSMISLPLPDGMGKIRAGGLTTRQLEVRIKKILKPDYLKNPSVSVQVLNFRPFFIDGEVKKPGQYEYIPGLTVLQAVAVAGGYTYRADKSDIRIKRASDKGDKGRKATQQTLVKPGDSIEIGERFF